MGLNFLKGILLLGVLGMSQVHATDELEEMNKKYLTITKIKVTRLEQDVFNQEISSVESEKDLSNADLSSLPGMPDAAGLVAGGKVGAIIAIGKELVALGESLYNLVQKGKPNVRTSYAPISVLPLVGKSPVDIFDTENWKAPRKFSYNITYENGFGMEVVNFRYDVVYAYGGSYNSKGAYLTAAQIIPVRINTSFGFDFSATMKLNGLQNHGSKESPIAGAILTMQYEISTVMQSSLESSTFHIMGNGGFKKL